MKRTLLSVGLFTLPFLGMAQSTYASYDKDYYHKVDKYCPNTQGAVKGYMRSSIYDGLANDSLEYKGNQSYYATKNIQAYLANDNWDYASAEDSILSTSKPVLKYFYDKKSAWYSVNQADFKLQVNPVLDIAAGYDKDHNGFLIRNTRGARMRGMIGNKVAFETILTDNQIQLPAYVQNRVDSNNVIPGEAFWKKNGTNGTDFLMARGYIQFNPIKQIGLQFGHDRNFVGNGYRSLILSDYAPAYLFLKAETNVWKIRYTNLFTEMSSTTAGTGANFLYPKKYVAFHHLGIDILDTKNHKLQAGAFEAIAFGRADSNSAGSFELGYLNPIIFYRSVEQNFGSPDNAILGIDWNYQFKNRYSFYGQIVLDEFKIDEVRSRSGWWANKQAMQMGTKAYDLFNLDGLDVLAELNVVRPYMYQHRDNYTNFTHYNQPLAHPLGANFREVIGQLRYQPTTKWLFVATAIMAKKGYDKDSINYGGDVRSDYRNIASQYGNKIGQGETTDLMYLSARANYMLFHNFFIEVEQTLRNQSSISGLKNETTFYTQFGIRWNIERRRWDF